jgi:hypothetical protein
MAENAAIRIQKTFLGLAFSSDFKLSPYLQNYQLRTTKLSSTLVHHTIGLGLSGVPLGLSIFLVQTSAC